MTVQQIKNQIRDLQVALAQNNLELKRETRANRTMNLPRLMEARYQIMLTIAHRQGLLIQILETEVAYQTTKEVA
jgi:hypothetical protein